MSTMEKSCPGAETLAGWIEGTLNPQDRSRIASHLSGCDECRRTVALSATLEDPPPVALNEILLSRVVSASRRRNWIPLGAAAAAVIAVGLGLALLSGEKAPVPAVERVVAEAPAPVVEAVSKPVAKPVPAPPAPAAPQPAPEPPKEAPAKPAPVEASKPAPVPPAPEKPADPVAPPAVEPAVVAKDPVTAPAPAAVDEKSLSPVFMLDPVGDLWVRRDREEAKAGALEKAAWKDHIAARSSSASFTFEARASVMLEKGSEVAFSHLKSDDSYGLSVDQGLVMLDTEGTPQRWRISFGKSELNFSDFNGRLAVESRGDRVSALLLDGKAQLKIGALAKPAMAGQEIEFTRDGQIVEKKVETQKKLARLDELRPKVFTAFAATFDEKKDEYQPYRYTVVAGRLASGPGGNYLQAEGPPSPKIGEKNPLNAQVRPERAFGVVSGMSLRFRYRTTLPSLTVKLGKYTAEFVARKVGQWADAEIPLREFTFEGTPMLPTDPVEDVLFTAFFDKRVGQLDIDGVQFQRRVR